MISRQIVEFVLCVPMAILLNAPIAGALDAQKNDVKTVFLSASKIGAGACSPYLKDGYLFRKCIMFAAFYLKDPKICRDLNKAGPAPADRTEAAGEAYNFKCLGMIAKLKSDNSICGPNLADKESKLCLNYTESPPFIIDLWGDHFWDYKVIRN